MGNWKGHTSNTNKGKGGRERERQRERERKSVRVKGGCTSLDHSEYQAIKHLVSGGRCRTNIAGGKTPLQLVNHRTLIYVAMIIFYL